MARAAVFRRPVITTRRLRGDVVLIPQPITPAGIDTGETLGASIVAVTWYAHYDTTTGELLSLGTVIPDPLPDGTDVLALNGQPDLSLVIWDTVSRTFVTRDPPVTVDRIDDLLADSSLSSTWAALDTTQQDALKTRVGQMLGPYRTRFDFQPEDLESGHPEIGQ